MRAVWPGGASPTQAHWAWARHWEFWLAVTLGAFLRLWRIDLTQFLNDQAGLMNLARLSVTRGLIPLTGIPSSINALNPPLTLAPLLPFAAVTPDPMPIAVSLALWNVVGVALTYGFALRYFGRRLAAVSALLFATCGAAVNYSRFIWQQNYMPPLLVLWALTLYLGCVEGRRRWFALNVALLAIATLLHLPAALLAPVTLVALALAPRLPPLGEWIVAVVVLAALAAPTILWEAISGISDLAAVRGYLGGHASINLSVFYFLFQALGGPQGSGGWTALIFALLNALAALLFAVGWLVLTARIITPARALPWRRAGQAAGLRGLLVALRDWLLALWRGLRADAGWRMNLLLWLSVTTPPALMLRHTRNLFAHYLAVLYPLAFIVSAIGAVAIIGWLAQAARGRPAPPARQSWLASSAPFALEAALLALILARSAQWVSVPLSLTDAASFDAYQNYGYPLSVIEQGAATLDRMQAKTGAATVEVITSSDPRYKVAEDYIFAGDYASSQSGQSGHITLASSCLALPPIGAAQPWLVAPVVKDRPLQTLLDRLPTAQRVGSLPMVGGPAYPVYQVRGASSLLSGETGLAPTSFTDQRGDRLSLLSATLPQAGQLLLRLRLDSVSVPAEQTRQFRIVASAGGSVAHADCETQRWQVGATLFMWVPLPGDGSTDIHFHLETASNGLATPSLGSLRFLSDLPTGQPLAVAAVSVGAPDERHARVAASGDDVVIPAGTLSPQA